MPNVDSRRLGLAYTARALTVAATRQLICVAAILGLVAASTAVWIPRPANVAQVSAHWLTPFATPTVAAPARFRPAPVAADVDWLAYAVLDRRTGQVWGSATMTETTWPASMVKAWLAADYLRRTAEAGRSPSAAMLAELDIMIRDSDNEAATHVYNLLGGDATIGRLVAVCGLADTTPGGGWSFVNISARDTVVMADCIADGRAAGPRWTSWLLGEMRTVRGEGDFGIRDALPADEASAVAIKNGWNFYVTAAPHLWHINCLAVADTWAMAVLERYRSRGVWDTDQAYGEQVCRQVAAQLLNPDWTGPQTAT